MTGSLRFAMRSECLPGNGGKLCNLLLSRLHQFLGAMFKPRLRLYEIEQAA